MRKSNPGWRIGLFLPLCKKQIFAHHHKNTSSLCFCFCSGVAFSLAYPFFSPSARSEIFSEDVWKIGACVFHVCSFISNGGFGFRLQHSELPSCPSKSRRGAAKRLSGQKLIGVFRAPACGHPETEGKKGVCIFVTFTQKFIIQKTR